jgi:hypothetical protein
MRIGHDLHVEGIVVNVVQLRAVEHTHLRWC